MSLTTARFMTRPDPNRMANPSGVRAFIRIRPGALTVLTALCLASASPVSAQGVAPSKPAAPLLASGPAFSSLTPYQAEVLKPLQPVWDEMEDVRKRKWIEIANRLPTLSDDEKGRVQQRMQEWAALTPAQRRQARDNFSEAKGRSAAERQAQWEEYQKLSPEARQALAERAQQELRHKRETPENGKPVGAAATTRPSHRNTGPQPVTGAPHPGAPASASGQAVGAAATANPSGHSAGPSAGSPGAATTGASHAPGGNAVPSAGHTDNTAPSSK